MGLKVQKIQVSKELENKITIAKIKVKILKAKSYSEQSPDDFTQEDEKYMLELIKSQHHLTK